MTPERALLAASILRHEAQCLKESHGRPSEGFAWPEGDEADDCDRQARADHDEMIELAGELEEWARGDRRA